MVRMTSKITTLVSIFGISLIFLEIVLRVFDPIGIIYYPEAERYFSKMIPDQEYGYIHTPGFCGKFQGVDVTINRHGLRGPEFEIKKSPGIKRILILGDSVIFGWGVPQNLILSARLQKLLDEKHANYQVIGAGVGSWNTRTEYEFFKKWGVKYDPDILILAVTANDILPKEAGHSDASKEKLFPLSGKNKERPSCKGSINIFGKWVIKKSYVLMYTTHIYRRNFEDEKECINTNNMNHDENSAYWEDAKLALTGIADICRNMNISLIVYLYGFGNDGNVYERFLLQRGIEFHLFPGYIYDLKYNNSKVDGHRNASGNQLMAEEVFKNLQPTLKQLDKK